MTIRVRREQGIVDYADVARVNFEGDVCYFFCEDSHSIYTRDLVAIVDSDYSDVLGGCII